MLVNFCFFLIKLIPKGYVYFFSQDLREVIEHVNKSNVNPSKTVNEPMTQIAKILNAHMDSLQWVDQNTNQLQRRVEEVSQLMESRKREHEKTFHLSYE